MFVFGCFVGVSVLSQSVMQMNMSMDEMGSNPTTCLEDSTQAQCSTYLYSDQNATTDTTSLCSEMSDMVGCTMIRHCNDGSFSGLFCTPFSILADTCRADSGMEMMDGCKNYGNLCKTGTKVQQCSTVLPLPNMPSSMDVMMNAPEVCRAVPQVPTCSGCSSTSCPDPMIVLGSVCQTNASLVQCGGWRGMCHSVSTSLFGANQDGGLAALCGPSCYAQAYQAKCSDFVYPAVNASQDIISLCAAMGYMPGCSLNNACAAHVDISQDLCDPISILGDICNVDGMTGMSGCRKYIRICNGSSTSGPWSSVVPACTAHPPFWALLTSNQVITDVNQICEETPLVPECVACKSTTLCMDPLASLSRLCVANLTAGCTRWQQMCTSAQGKLNAFCALTCLDDSSQSACADYVYDPTSANKDLDSLCGEMPQMTGCTIRTLCNSNKASGQYCQPMSLLADICLTDQMSTMSGCTNYNKLCLTTNKTSVVKQCTTSAPIPSFPTTFDTINKVVEMCQEMPMPGCDSCTSSNCPDPLSSLVQLCSGMYMSQCSVWQSMCGQLSAAHENGLNSLCTGAEVGKRVPEMRMYFHFSLADYMLFKGWVPQDKGQYVGTWLFFFALAIFSVFLKSWRRTLEDSWTEGCIVAAGTEPLKTAQRQCKVKFPLVVNAKRSVIVMVIVLIDYCLMLVAMTFNVGILIAVVTGYGTGTFFFGHHIRKRESIAIHKCACCGKTVQNNPPLPVQNGEGEGEKKKGEGGENKEGVIVSDPTSTNVDQKNGENNVHGNHEQEPLVDQEDRLNDDPSGQQSPSKPSVTVHY